MERTWKIEDLYSLFWLTRPLETITIVPCAAVSLNFNLGHSWWQSSSQDALVCPRGQGPVEAVPLSSAEVSIITISQEECHLARFLHVHRHSIFDTIIPAFGLDFVIGSVNRMVGKLTTFDVGIGDGEEETNQKEGEVPHLLLSGGKKK